MFCSLVTSETVRVSISYPTIICPSLSLGLRTDAHFSHFLVAQLVEAGVDLGRVVAVSVRPLTCHMSLKYLTVRTLSSSVASW
jgi:hypothetical protein